MWAPMVEDGPVQASSDAVPPSSFKKKGLRYAFSGWPRSRSSASFMKGGSSRHKQAGGATSVLSCAAPDIPRSALHSAAKLETLRQAALGAIARLDTLKPDQETFVSRMGRALAELDESYDEMGSLAVRKPGSKAALTDMIRSWDNNSDGMRDEHARVHADVHTCTCVCTTHVTTQTACVYMHMYNACNNSDGMRVREHARGCGRVHAYQRRSAPPPPRLRLTTSC